MDRYLLLPPYIPADTFRGLHLRGTRHVGVRNWTWRLTAILDIRVFCFQESAPLKGLLFADFSISEEGGDLSIHFTTFGVSRSVFNTVSNSWPFLYFVRPSTKLSVECTQPTWWISNFSTASRAACVSIIRCFSVVFEDFKSTLNRNRESVTIFSSSGRPSNLKMSCYMVYAASNESANAFFPLTKTEQATFVLLYLQKCSQLVRLVLSTNNTQYQSWVLSSGLFAKLISEYQTILVFSKSSLCYSSPRVGVLYIMQ